MQEFILKSADGFPLSCAQCEAGSATKGTVLIVHGAKEDKTRYYDFADYLSRGGFHVFLLDLRGHGQSVSPRFPLGFMDGWKPMVQDIMAAAGFAKEQYSLPFFMFAHSFGSVLARCLLQENDRLLDGLVLSGTVRYLPSTILAVPAAKVITGLQGKHAHSRILMRLGDPVSDYADHRFCNASVVTDWSAIRELARTERFRAQNPSLPILSVTGADDPFTGGERGLQRTIRLLQRCGYQNVTSIVYPQMPHGLIHASKKERVWTDIAEFLSSAIARS